MGVIYVSKQTPYEGPALTTAEEWARQLKRVERLRTECQQRMEYMEQLGLDAQPARAAFARARSRAAHVRNAYLRWAEGQGDTS